RAEAALLEAELDLLRPVFLAGVVELSDGERRLGLDDDDGTVAHLDLGRARLGRGHRIPDTERRALGGRALAARGEDAHVPRDELEHPCGAGARVARPGANKRSAISESNCVASEL